MLKNGGIPGRNTDCMISSRGILLDLGNNTNGVRQVQVERNVSESIRLNPSSVSHRGAVSFDRLLQVVIVGQDLHEEVELQSLRLQDKK